MDKLTKIGQTLSTRQKGAIFIEKLDNLFDILHANALEVLKIDEYKQFLINHRKKGRSGFVHGIDNQLDFREELAEEKSQETVVCSSSSFSSGVADSDENGDEIIENQQDLLQNSLAHHRQKREYCMEHVTLSQQK